jgi:pimeloyl-ACP methyl ester carboxylesterase
MYTMNVNGAQIAFDDQGLGGGPAILLLTGFDESLPHLLPRHRVVCMNSGPHDIHNPDARDFVTRA